MPYDLLRDRARAAIRHGHLTARKHDLVLGVHGSGKPCAVCREPIRREQEELEVVFNQAGLEPYHFHPRCFAAWEVECAMVDGSSH
jgi:hypothetical protein